MHTAQTRHVKRVKVVSALSLITSSSTLICCALPALLVALGAGAALSFTIAAVPQLVWFSEHKLAIFIFASVMLMFSGYMQWRAKSLPCPVDPQLAKVCAVTRKRSLYVYLISLGLYIVGGAVAFVLPLFN